MEQTYPLQLPYFVEFFCFLLEKTNKHANQLSRISGDTLNQTLSHKVNVNFPKKKKNDCLLVVTRTSSMAGKEKVSLLNADFIVSHLLRWTKPVQRSTLMSQYSFLPPASAQQEQSPPPEKRIEKGD